MIPYFSAIIRPLHTLALAQKDKRTLHYDKEELDAFYKIKHAVANAISLSPLILNHPIKMASDASKFCCASLIWQIDPETNEIRYLAAISRLFEKREIMWSIFRKECCAILVSLSVHNWMLRGAPIITAYTDSRAILFLRNSKNRQNILFRFSQTISCYEIEVVHVAGKENFICDHITRSIYPEDQPKETISISELTSNELCSALVLQRGFKLDASLVHQYMIDDGLPEIKQSRMKTGTPSKAKLNAATNKPTVKKERNIKSPRVRKTKIPKDKIDAHSLFFRKDPSTLSKSKKVSNTQNYDLECHELRVLFKDDDLDHSSVSTKGPSELDVILGHNDDPHADHDTMSTHPDFPSQKMHESNSAIENLRVHHLILNESLISINTIIYAQESDHFFGPYCNGTKALPTNWKKIQGVLCLVKDSIKIMLPNSLFHCLFHAKHLSLWTKHTPTTTLFQEISKTYYNPNLLQMIENAVKQCTACPISKKSKQMGLPFGQKIHGRSAREIWRYDALGGCNPSQGYKYIFVFTCSLTLYTYLFPTREKNATSLLRAIQNLISIFFRPRLIYGDMDPSLLSTIVKEYLTNRGIEIQTTCPYSAWANSTAEQTIAQVKETIRGLILATGKD